MKRAANLIRKTFTSVASTSRSCSNDKANFAEDDDKDDDSDDKDDDDNSDSSAATKTTIRTRDSRMDQDYDKHWSSVLFCL